MTRRPCIKGPPPRQRQADLQSSERSGDRLDVKATDLRRGVQAISTPKEAVEAMVAAGAVFAVQWRADTLGMSFTYRVESGGDLERARAILAAVKAKPPVFLQAFRALVQKTAGPIT